ncbi:hypothetical protein RHMOL_Rhmol07G0201400 [Rhododendron molle]|uniref:Uncharacterized protein n=1 Tax=Rhododendron molle TaxID=49168 RepID=A0ACC0N4P9_RHOML|nr:hypothetical protein RHMOL_Rhmol07G0201400 [Rhododendron molle]
MKTKREEEESVEGEEHSKRQKLLNEQSSSPSPALPYCLGLNLIMLFFHKLLTTTMMRMRRKMSEEEWAFASGGYELQSNRDDGGLFFVQMHNFAFHRFHLFRNG